MSNKVENNVVLDNVSLDTVKTEMLHYRGNSLSYKLGFLGIGFSILAAFICLNSFYPDFLGFIKILMNIAILLFGFMCCEKVKSYSKGASIVLCGIGGVCVLRIFWIPMNIMVWYNKFIAATAVVDNPEATEAEKLVANDTINTAGRYLGSIITKSGNNINWLPKDGNFRGVCAIVLLSCAAAAFISAGVIGLIKSKKFAASLEAKNN